VAHRPQGRRGPGRVHRGPGCSAYPQVTRGPAGTATAHLAADPDTGIITDEQLTKAAGSNNADPAVAARFLTNNTATATPTTPPRASATARPRRRGRRRQRHAAATRREWYGDSAYGTGDLRGAIDDAGHEALIKPKPLQSAVEGGSTLNDFTVNEAAGTVTCPTGNTRPISRTGVATLGALCRDCHCGQRCTTPKTRLGDGLDGVDHRLVDIPVERLGHCLRRRPCRLLTPRSGRAALRQR
jgi:hypothetical protein